MHGARFLGFVRVTDRIFRGGIARRAKVVSLPPFNTSLVYVISGSTMALWFDDQTTGVTAITHGTCAPEEDGPFRLGRDFMTDHTFFELVKKSKSSVAHGSLSVSSDRSRANQEIPRMGTPPLSAPNCFFCSEKRLHPVSSFSSR